MLNMALSLKNTPNLRHACMHTTTIRCTSLLLLHHHTHTVICCMDTKAVQIRLAEVLMTKKHLQNDT